MKRSPENRPGTADRLRALGLALIVALGLGLAGGARAQDAPIPWSSLSAEQRQVLADTQSNWDALAPDQQKRLQRAADRWAGMDEGQRAKTKQRMARWKAMPPERRKALREHARHFRELPPEQRARLHEFRKEFRALPKETQQQFRECQRSLQDDETRDCREVWPPALRETYADLPEPRKKSRNAKGRRAAGAQSEAPPPSTAD